MVKKEVLIGGVLLILVVVGSLYILNSDTSMEKNVGDTQNQLDGNTLENSIWREALLTDINSGKEFRISDFSNKPVLLESFAVWCPTCTSQQKEIKKLHDEIGDSVISISLDTDPNEDETKVKSHTLSNGFDWIYAISPVDVTKSLIDEFGISFVNAPSAPMVLICPDGTPKKLRTGVKTSSELKTEIENCNN